MGTNYYLHHDTCPHCGRSNEKVHIGKSSGGWCFALHIHNEEWQESKIESLEDWQKEWLKPGTVIKDEYGNWVPPAKMLSIIVDRENYCKDWDSGWWRGFYESEAHFHMNNNSERGPNGLLRHKLDRRCIGHGDGTYDLIVGDFS